MADTRFRESVIMLTHHRQHSVGFVLNKPTETGLREIVAPLGINLIRDWPVYWGGPVAASTVWILHDSGWQHPHSVAITDQWMMLSHVTMFDQFVDLSLPLHFRIFIGCASWAPEQLMMEIQGEPPWSPDTSWLTLKDPDQEMVLREDVDSHWSEATDQCVRAFTDQCLRLD